MSKIFFSYSWKDLPIAMRIYADLVRNGIPVWRDEFSATPGKKYETEINEAIKQCKGVILMDSENSRVSKYVQDEWSVLTNTTDWKTGQKKLAICLIGTESLTHGKPELFPDQNKYRYIDFSKCKQLFDNDRSYLLAITDLCKSFGIAFSPYYETSAKDFEDELSKYEIKDIDRTILLKEFDLIQFRLTHGFPNTIRRLEFFTRECESLKLICPSPILQLGIEFFKSGEFTQAKHLLSFYTNAYPDDPRGWRAFGSTLFELAEFEQALSAYNNTILLSLYIKWGRTKIGDQTIRFNNKKILSYLFMSRMNKATTLLELGQYKRAMRAYRQAFTEIDTQILPEHYLIVIDACATLEEQEKWITTAVERFRGDHQLTLAKARYLLMKGCFSDAMDQYARLAKKDTPDLEVYAEYLPLLLKNTRRAPQFSCAYQKALQIEPITNKEIYKYGFILYLGGNIPEAWKYYEKSNYKELPWYEYL